MAVDRRTSLGALLREYRRRSGLGQRDLAERAGLSVTTVRDLEQGRTRQPQPASVRALATALGLDEQDAARLRDAAAAVAEPEAVEEPGPVRLEILGPLTLRRGSTEVALGRGGRRVVLARLALSANTPVPVHELVDLVWGTQPPPDPHQLLQSYVSRLRLTLEPARSGRSGRSAEGVVSLGTGGYRLALAEQQLDLAEFRGQVRAAWEVGPPRAVELLESALRLWRDVPLADVFELHGHPLVTALIQEQLAAAIRYADVVSQLGAYRRALPRLLDLAAAHPLHEPLHARLITTLAGAGLQADALAAYEAIRRRLDDDLGIDPGPELAEAHQRVLRQEIAPAPPQTSAEQPPSAETAGSREDAGSQFSRPAGLPADLVGFAGRVSEIDELDALLPAPAEEAGKTGGLRIVVVSGTGGVGKTTLAVHWAHKVSGRFPDGQLYINLRGFDPGGTAASPAEAVRSFLDALGVPAQRVPSGLDAQTTLYRSLLAERRMLVLLDNARDAEQVRPLLPGTPGCLVLVTSRHQLTGLIVGAAAFPLPLDLLDPIEARDLLGRRIGAGRVAVESEAVEEIIERCVRLPLALAVVAARAANQPKLPLAALAAELRRRERLDTLATGDPGTDVRSVFSWSYQELSQPAARLFRLLGLHPGRELSRSAAASLAGVTPAQVQPVLAELVRVHLVTERMPGRYTLHDLLRAYAVEQSESEPEAERQTALHRLIDHYLHSAHRADVILEPKRDAIELAAKLHGVTTDDVESAAAEWFTAEYQVLTATVALAVDAGLDRQAWQLVWSMSAFFDRHRNFRDAVVLHRAALQAAQRLKDLAAQAYSHRMLGKGYASLGEPDQARAHLEHALEVFQQLGEHTKQAHVHLGLAQMLEEQGRDREALHQVEQALAGYRASGDRVGEANALNALGWFHTKLGDYKAALECCKQALGPHQELGDRRGEAATWDSLGMAYHHLARRTEAVASFERALALFRDLGYRYNEADTLVHLGETHQAAGATPAARETRQQALAILSDLGHPHAEQVRSRLRDSGDGDADSLASRGEPGL